MWLKSLNKWRAKGIPSAIVTVIRAKDTTPCDIGSKMVVNVTDAIAGTVGEVNIEHACREQALKAIKENRSISLDFSLREDVWKVTSNKDVQDHCVGVVTVFIEPVPLQEEIVIFGGGHICDKISKYCEIIAIPYRVFDNRADFPLTERYPTANECICKPYETLSETITLTRASYCVILTYKHKYDEICLEQIIQNTEIPYIGMSGNQDKIRTIVNNIRSRGNSIDDRIYSPVGLNIANKQPEQIALGIMAQIIMLINKGTPEHFRIPWHKENN